MADEFGMICDFDRLARPWSAESGSAPGVRFTTEKAHSGKACLRVDVQRIGGILRATWGCDLFDVELMPESRFRFYIHGGQKAKATPGQPHGGLILIEAGGRADGGNSHWMLDIPGDIYAGGGWKEFVTLPVADAHNPDWAKDADGKIDLNRIERALFVLQQDDAAGNLPPFTIHMEDFSASNWRRREPVVKAAENSSVPEHVRPVQRGFIGRKRDAGQVITFSDVSGWRVVQYPPNEATFVRSEEEPLFGEAVGKLTYRSAGGSGYIRLEPPKPIRLSRFNGVLMWVFGNNWAWVPDPKTPQVLISLEITDKSGEKHLIDLDNVDWKFWSMMHKCVRANAAEDERHTAYGGDCDGKLNFPASLAAIEVRRGSNSEFRSIYFDSIIFREERPNLPEFKADLTSLPFPTTPDTILPSVIGAPVANSVVGEGAVFRFRAGDDLEYVYAPMTGTLSDLTVRLGDVEFKPCEGAGPRIDGRTPASKLVSAKLNADGSLRTHWKAPDKIEYALTLRISGKSLICDWASKGARITEFSLGQASGLKEFKLFNVPYLTMGFGTPAAILWNQGAYCFTILDHYNTNASQFYGRTEKLADSCAAYNGGSRYLPMTDGRRNPLRERQFITVSRLFEEVLPNIPNPPSPFAEVTGTHLYCHVGGIALDRFQNWLKTWKLYKQYGIDRVRLSHHEDGWSDGDTHGQGPQEFTMTLEAAPEIGDEQLIAYCREVREMGWLIGLYSNYTDYSMLGKSWDERNVTRNPNGEWRRVWPPCFNIKPLKAVEMEAYFAPRIAEKFGTNTVYCDVHTCVAPWDNVDYEAGTPNAGMLATTFKAYGALMMNERKAYGGPVFSEGVHHWFYAGLNDGNYAQMGLPDPSNQPLLLDFDLRKIHPLQANVSMLPDWSWGDGFYHLWATQIAYGHIGFLPVADIETAARGYYLMQQLQARYTMVPVEEVLYHAKDDGMLPISEALPAGANLENQAYVRYANGLEVYVNCNREKRWKVTAGGRDFNLAPYSWVCVGPEFLEYSTEIDGRRTSFVDSPVYTYADAGDKAYDFGPLETAGSLVIRKDDPRGLKIIPISGTASVRLAKVAARKATAFSGDGKDLGTAEFDVKDGGTTIRFQREARYYIVES